MNRKLDHKEIGKLLDKSTERLDRSTLDSLRTARQHAVQHQRAGTSGWVGRDGLLYGHVHLSQRAFNWLLVAAIVTLLAINLTYWDNLYDHEHVDLDIAILTDDMPVDVYVDQDE